jgi:hypothetical protein
MRIIRQYLVEVPAWGSDSVTGSFDSLPLAKESAEQLKQERHGSAWWNEVAITRLITILLPFGWRIECSKTLAIL